MKYPSPLKRGSNIAISAFSFPVSRDYERRFTLVLANLKSFGYNVIVGQSVRQKQEMSAKYRAQELQDFLLDDDIDAIIPPWGGQLVMEILPLLDWHRLQKVKPKWILGFSDVSTLLTAITTKLNWATVHGTNLMQIITAESCEYAQGALSVLQHTFNEPLVQLSSLKCEELSADYKNEPSATFKLTKNTQWYCLDTGLITSPIIGRLIGGCLDTHMHIFNTEFADIEHYKHSFKGEGVIMYLENGDLHDYAYIRALLGLKFQGVFNGVSGVLIGRNPNIHDIDAEKVCLERSLGDLKIPVIFNVDIGHIGPNLVLINGAKTEVLVNNTRYTISQKQ